MRQQGTTYDDLKKALEKNSFSPVYLFHGREDFLVDEAAELVIAAALTDESREFNLDIMHGSDADVRDVVSHASSFPMMSDRRVVVVRDFDRLAGKELLASYVERPSPTTCLVLLSAKPDFRRKPYVVVKKHGTVVEFEPLYDSQVPGWITDRVRQQGRNIDSEAASVLAAYVGNSMREIQTELDKLYLFATGKATMTEEDVRSVVGMSREYNVFELQRAIGAKDHRRSTEILEHMLDVGESGVMIAAMLTKYFSTLLKLIDVRQRGLPPQETAKTVGIHPYSLKDYQAALAQYSLRDIECSFSLLVDADRALKLSAEPRDVMHALVVQLLGETQTAHRL